MTGTTIPSLRVGQTVDITIEAAEGGGQYKSRIEDVDGEKLQVAMPTHRGELVIPAMGRIVQIAAQSSSGSTVFIQAEVTGRQNQPFPILTVKVLSASQQQARSYYRADVTVWPAECSVWGEAPAEHSEDGHATHEDGHAPSPAAVGHVPGAAHHAFWRPVHASLHDLSGGGAALLAHEHIREGERVKLRFPLPHGGGEVGVTGEVRRSVSRGRDQKGEVRWDVGVAFDNLKAEQRDKLVKAVNRVQAEERRRANA